MRLSISKRSNPFADSDMNRDENEETKGKSSSSKSSQNDHDYLEHVKANWMASNESNSDALQKLMSNRHKQEEILDQLEKIYSCESWLKQFKVYDAFNDDPERCSHQDNVELVDEIKFMNEYRWSECYNVTCPDCIQENYAWSQNSCSNCCTEKIY